MIVVTLIAPLATLLHQQGSSAHVSSSQKYLPLFNWMKRHSARLEPTFPGIPDESMQVFFELHSSKLIAEKDLEELRKLEGVDGAYIKGDASLPE